jgi:dienelactone hydrolase
VELQVGKTPLAKPRIARLHFRELIYLPQEDLMNRMTNRMMLAVGMLLSLASQVQADIRMQTVEYKDGDNVLKGYLAYDDATEDFRPGVVIFPEWWGVTDYPKHRADQLAKMGYVAFVGDIYGNGETTDDPKKAGALAGPFLTDRKSMRRRSQLALDTLLSQKYVDKSRVAAIGYCFGGTCALELARAGAPLSGVVSFHGGLGRTADEGPDKITAKILICHGGADPLVPPPVLADFEAEMVETGTNYQINIYSGAKHAFTNPASDSHHIPGIGYNQQADRRSWSAMKDFFEEIFK